MDAVGIDAANTGRPGWCFGLVIGFTDQVSTKPIITAGIAVKEIPVEQILCFQHIGQPQHHRHIGARDNCQPLCALWGISTLRADIDAAHPFAVKFLEPAIGFVMGNAAHTHLGILRVDASEHHQGLRMLGNHRPRVLLAP